MKTYSHKQVAVGSLSGVSGQDRKFKADFAPYYSGKRFGLFQRDTLNYDFSLSSTTGYLNLMAQRYQKSNELLENIKTAHATERHYFQQTQTIEGKEKFISIIGNTEIEEERFKTIVSQIALNKHVWKWGISSDMVIKVDDADGKKISIYQDGELLEFGRWQKIKNKFTERKNPYEAIQNGFTFLPEIEKLTQTLKAQELSFKVIGLFSDIHTADKTEIDNFGAEKAEHLKVLLQQMIDEKTPLMINGDFFELWQSVFEHIKESYADVFELMRQLPLIVMLPGNHDDEVTEHKDVNAWVKELLPNAVIVPHFMHSFKNLDMMMVHGDIADPMNNNTVFGKFIAKLATLPERWFNNIDKGKNSVEQDLEGAGRKFFFSDSSLIEGEIINYFNHLMSMIKLYRYINASYLKQSAARDLILVYGHTHDLVKHKDATSRLQSMLYQVISQISEIDNVVDVHYINTGGGSGENLAAEMRMNKDDWKKYRKLTLEQTRQSAAKKRAKNALGESPREDFTFIDIAKNEIAYLKGYLDKRIFGSLQQ